MQDENPYASSDAGSQLYCADQSAQKRPLAQTLLFHSANLSSAIAALLLVRWFVALGFNNDILVSLLAATFAVTILFSGWKLASYMRKP